MITRAHITRRASRDGVPARTVERDYVLAHVVAAVGALGSESRLVFKGGTALRLCHVQDYRYSADLDFPIVGGSLEDGLDDVTRALGSSGGSVEGLRLTHDRPPRIAYTGPLGRERMLKLDLVDDELVLHTEDRALLPQWPDLPRDVTVRVYSMLEIAGEKLRCVLQRLQCRDLFDLHLLFEALGVDAGEAAEVFRPKAEHRGFDPALLATRYPERLEQYGKRWAQELAEHVPAEVPHFEIVARAVSRHLRRAGLR